MQQPSQPALDMSGGDATGASALDRLLMEREMHLVLCRYARACDERDWAAMHEVFTPDCVADYVSKFGAWHCPDRDAIVSMVRQNLGGCGPTQHLLGNLLVENVQGTWRSRMNVRAAHRGVGELKDLRYDAMGEYIDEWALTPAGWRIARRRMEMALEMGDRRVLRPSQPPETAA